MGDLFWLNDEAWTAIEPHLPKNQPGARRVDDRRVISRILHVLKSGCRWRDCPSVYGPHTTIYNRFNRWSRRRIWQKLLQALVETGWIETTATIDATYFKAHRSAHGGIFNTSRKAAFPRAPRLSRSPTEGSEMDEEADVENIIALCDKLSTVCRGYKNRVVQQATLNVCAAALVNVSGTLHQAERTANELALRLKEAMLKQPESAVDDLALQLKEGARNQAEGAADELALRLEGSSE